MRCSCGRKYTVFKRDDMLAMENAAKKFEQEKDIHMIVEGQMNCNYGIEMLSLPYLVS